jgi:hypothetical protein
MAGPYANSNANMDDKVVPQRLRDVTGRLKISRHQNVYEADFEYGKQVLRWEEFTNGAATVTHLPGTGGVRMSVTSASGDITIRQSRPYHRYQPGKTMAMYTYVNMGAANANQVQRVGFFDDSNGVFFEQGNPAPATNNPFGMSVNLRSDVGGMPFTRSIPLNQWNGDRAFIDSIQWDRGQMLFVEYAWYGGGGVRFGLMIDSDPYILHQEPNSNIQGRTVAWSRTGNLPVRYEQRNTGASVANDMIHYGVSVMVEGGVDDQRGFTYTYGMALGTPTRTVAAATTRFPVLSIRMRVMGTQEYTQATAAITAGTTTSLTAGTAAWTVNQWRGRCVNYIVAGVSYVARISSNTATVLTIEDVVIGGAVAVAPVAGQNYTIGLINRGQLLPKRLIVSSSALAQCEIFFSTPTSPIILTGASFTAMSTLGSANSFAERDVSATSFTGGERIKKFLLPSGGSGLEIFDLLDLFPLYNTLRGSLPDIMTLAVTTQAATSSNVGADFDAQEAMS